MLLAYAGVMTLSVFTGTLLIRERIAIPAPVVATVKLVSADGEVLAATAVEADSVPVEFSVTVDPEILGAHKHLSLWAFVRSSVGAWGTLELAPVKGNTAEVVLTRIPE